MKVDLVLRNKGDQVITMPHDASVDEAVKLLVQLGIGAVMICDQERNLCGILAERDIVQGLSDHGVQVLQAPVSLIMRRNISSCGLETHINDVMELMTDRRVRHIPVFDGQQELCGVISIGDVVKARIAEIESEARELRQYIAMA